MGKWTRRAFISTGVLTGGALLIGVGTSIAVRPGHRTPKLAGFMQKDGETLINAWVKILPDNSTKIIVPHVEMGQGSHTVMAMMLADEMDTDWSTVSVEEAPAHEEYVTFHLARDYIYPDAVPGIVEESLNGGLMKVAQMMNLQITGGSYSVRGTGERGMRVAGAAAREMFIRAAAKKWQVAQTELRTQNSTVHHDASGRSAPYSQLATAVAAEKPPQNPRLKSPEQFNIMGKQSVQRLDIPSKVNGSAQFAIDADLPGMKYAAIVSAPVFGSTVDTLDSQSAEQNKGIIKVVNLDDAVAVIADGFWQAKKAAAQLDISWSKTEFDTVDSDAIFDQFRADMDGAVKSGSEKLDYTAGDARAVFEQAGQIIEAEYRVPFLAHATMEPMTCTAWLHDDKLELWTGTQNPLGSRIAAADAIGLDRENVELHNLYLGGGFGRRASSDYEIQAARLAKQVSGTPVKLIWSREQDMQHDQYRPAITSRFKAALAADGRPSAWENQFVNKHEPAEAPDIPYKIDNKLVHHTDSPTHVPFGPWRSVDHSQHAFFTESFIDELAYEAEQDAYRYRRDLLADNPRMQNVLDTAARMANWGREMPAGSAQGIAIHASFGTIVAQVVEVDTSSGKPKVKKVFCAADAGYAMSPDGFKAQMESGIVFALSAALYGDIKIENGRVKQSNFHDYKMVRMNTSPEIEVTIINSGEKVGGAGEPGTPPLAPALANAIFAATGKRIRTLPIES